MGKIKDITGEKFGKLFVLSFSYTENKRAFWNCECECGKVKAIRSHDLLAGKVNSCGCLKVEQARQRNYKHGHSVRGAKTRAWDIWRGMTERCRNPNHASWSNYGGRGIKVCRRWLEFSNFLADMGEPEKGFFLDRINKDGDYCPQNCRWANKDTQARNTSRNILLTYSGKTQCLTDWAKEYGIIRGAIEHRLKRGWSIEEALTTPVTRYATRPITKSITSSTKSENKAVRNLCKSPGYIASEDTQVLTSRGWVDALDLDGTEEVAQMGDKNLIVFEKPLDVIKKHYSGRMIQIASNKINMLVTPNHRIARVARSGYPLQYVYAEELLSKPEIRIPLSGVCDGEIFLPDNDAKLLAAFLADGYHSFEQTGWHLRKLRKQERLVELFNESGIEYKVFERPNGSIEFKVPLIPFSKDIDPLLALYLSLQTKRVILKELIHWDGSKSSSSTQSKYCCYISSVRKNHIDFYELLAITSGWGCKRRVVKDPRNPDWSTLYGANIVEDRRATTLTTPEHKGSLEVSNIDNYVGTAFCLETSTANFFVRHRGSVFITGSSVGCN